MALWDRRSNINLFGNSINVKSGDWLHNYAGIGAGHDSLFVFTSSLSHIFGVDNINFFVAMNTCSNHTYILVKRSIWICLRHHMQLF